MIYKNPNAHKRDLKGLSEGVDIHDAIHNYREPQFYVPRKFSEEKTSFQTDFKKEKITNKW